MAQLQTDVAVIGLGAMGSMTLWQLAERGVSTIGFEQFEPGHDRGSSHGETRIFRTAYLEGPGYVPLAQRAVALWHELKRVTGEPVVVQNGALMLGARDGAVITGTMASIRAHNLPHRLLEADDIRALYPAHRVGPEEVAIQENEAGFVGPEMAVIAAARLAEHLGARVVRGVKIDRLEPRGEGVRVVAGDTVCDARHAIVSVGAWLGKLLPDLHLPLRVTRQVLAWFPIDHPQQFTPDRFPVFLRDIGDDFPANDPQRDDSTFYGFPTLDDRTIKVAVHREARVADPDALDRAVTPEDVAPVREYVRRFLHGVGKDPVRTLVCMYTNTPDHDFLIGSLDGMPQVTILGGFSGHGFKFAPVVGEIGADLASRGVTDHPVQFLSPNRFPLGEIAATR